MVNVILASGRGTRADLSVPTPPSPISSKRSRVEGSCRWTIHCWCYADEGFRVFLAAYGTPA